MRRSLLLAVTVGALAACAEGEPAMPQDVLFTATDYAFAGPDTIKPGVTTIRFENHGNESHHLIMARFEDGYGMPDLMAYADTNATGEPPFMTFLGAAGTVEPHHGDASTADLPAGNYVLLCFVPDAQGVPHLNHGMVHEFVATGDRHDAPLPEAVATIRMADYSFSPVELTAGTHTFHIVNDGPQIHEVQLVRLHDGATVEQFMAALAPGAGPPPGNEIGGSGALTAGQENYWTVDFEPGNYLLICFVPDIADGMPHFMKGMVRPVTVSAG